MIASRSDPAPLSFVLITVKLASSVAAVKNARVSAVIRMANLLRQVERCRDEDGHLASGDGICRAIGRGGAAGRDSLGHELVDEVREASARARHVGELTRRRA